MSFSDEPMDEDVYEVEEIVDAMCQDAVMFYLVRWKGYGPEEDTWEPSEHLLSCQQLQEDFWNLREHKMAFERGQEKKKKGEKGGVSNGKKNLTPVEEQKKNRSVGVLNSNSKSVALEMNSLGKSGQTDTYWHTEKAIEELSNSLDKETFSTTSVSHIDASSNQQKPQQQNLEHYDLSSISYTYSEDDMSDTDTRTKELLAKWGDRRYQKKSTGAQSLLAKQKSPSKLLLKSSKYSYKEEKSENGATSSNLVKHNAMPVKKGDHNITYTLKQNNFMPSPDKTLLSSESITNIIQQDLLERENKRRTAPLKSVEYDELPGQGGINVCNASTLKPVPPTNNSDKTIKSRLRAGFSTENYGSEMINTELKTNMRLAGNETQSKVHISKGSELRKKLRDLGSGINIRDLMREQLSDKNARSGKEKGGVLSSNKQMGESVSSKSNQTKKKGIFVDKGGGAPLLQEYAQAKAETQGPSKSDSKQQAESTGEQVHVRKDPKQPQTKRTVINKSNLDRIKSIMKDALKEKSRECAEGNDEKCALEDKKSTLEKRVLSGTQDNFDKRYNKKGNIQSIGGNGHDKSKTMENKEGNFIVEEMRVDEIHGRLGNIGKEKGEKNERRLDETDGPLGTLQIKTRTKSMHTKDDVRGKHDTFMGNQARASSGSVIPSADSANRIGSATGILAQDPRLFSRENRLLETIRMRPDSKTTRMGPTSDRVHTDSGKVLNDRRQMKRCDLEKGESILKVGHESIKQGKANEKVESRDTSKCANRVDTVGTVRSPNLGPRDFSGVTRVITANVGDGLPKRGAFLKRDFAEVTDSRERNALDTRKKLKALRYSFQKQPSKEQFPPAADDVLGGILGKSSILRAIDEGVNKRSENSEESPRNDPVEMERRLPCDVAESAFDLDEFYIDDDGLFPIYEDNNGEVKRYIDSIDVSGITPIDMSPDEFVKSIQAGDWCTILGALASGHSADSWDYGIGGTLLWKAIEENNHDIARKLIKFGADTEVKAENGKTALMFAVETGRFGFVDMLLKSGSHINAQQHNEETALILACRKGDEDIVNLLLCYGVDSKLTPKSNPKGAHEYAPEYQIQVIKRLIDLYNMKLMNITAEVLKHCLLGTETSIGKPQLCRCVTPGERIMNEFYFNCQLNAAEKGVTILLLCAPIKFAPSGDITLHLERKIDNGIDVVILNKEYQIPVVQGSHILYFLFPKVGQLNTLSIRTHKCGYKLLLAVYSIEQSEPWVDSGLDSFYKEFGIANNVKFTKQPK